MFSLDSWQEILDTVLKNKLRTILTGFSVAWGIFMLILLLGSGRGLSHGIEYQFRDDAINSVWVSSGTTSTPYKGMQPGRSIQFRNRDYDEIRGAVDRIEHMSGRFWIRGSTTVSFGRESGNFEVRAVHPGHRYLEKTIVRRGRYLNDLDIREHRKVAILGAVVEKDLFKGADAIGEHVVINGIAFLVVGVFEDEGGENEMQRIYLPISTAQRVFNGGDRLGQMMFTTGDATVDEGNRMVEEVRVILARRHAFDPEDKRAVFVWNNYEEFARFVGVMNGIRLFVWVIGIGTLLAGVVGVSNIMLIAVRERTREIGIRKAMGATPGSILGLVLQEAIFITGIAGYVGLVLGVLVLEGAAKGVSGAEMFRNPEVDLGIAAAATGLLVLAGTVAGFLPARRAAAIRPIEALRDE